MRRASSGRTSVHPSRSFFGLLDTLIFVLLGQYISPGLCLSQSHQQCSMFFPCHLKSSFLMQRLDKKRPCHPVPKIFISFKIFPILPVQKPEHLASKRENISQPALQWLENLSKSKTPSFNSLLCPAAVPHLDPSYSFTVSQ